MKLQIQKILILVKFNLKKGKFKMEESYKEKTIEEIIEMGVAEVIVREVPNEGLKVTLLGDAANEFARRMSKIDFTGKSDDEIENRMTEEMNKFLFNNFKFKKITI